MHVRCKWRFRNQLAPSTWDQEAIVGSRGVGTSCEVGFLPGADGPCPRRQDNDQPHHEAQTWINTRAARNKLALTMLVIRDICGE